jgi:uncharacterized protein DUF3854
MVIDVHPDHLDEVRTGTSSLFVTEGVKTGESINSRGVPTIILAGVWNWVNQDGPLPCWDHVRLDGRRVFVAFDSDVMVKGEVQKALAHLIGFLESRGADVLAVYLPDSPDGSKQGLDDFLAAVPTVSEVYLLGRQVDPDEFAEIRSRRDPELREAIAGLRARFWAEEWPGRSGHSRRDLYLALIRAASRHGKATTAGIEVSASLRDLALSAAVGSLNTVRGGLDVLVDRGLIGRYVGLLNGLPIPLLRLPKEKGDERQEG